MLLMNLGCFIGGEQLCIFEVKLLLPKEQQYGDEDDLVESFDSKDESEYNELPFFKRLTKKKHRYLAYFDELEYRGKLLMKRQLKEERRQRKMMKKMVAAAKEQSSEYRELTMQKRKIVVLLLFRFPCQIWHCLLLLILIVLQVGVDEDRRSIL
ncbi:hypothetical protein V6N13_069440 [Hibiscus sabdariffa]